MNNHLILLTDVLGFSVSRKIEMETVGLSAVFVEKYGSKIELMKYRGKNVPKRLEVAKLKIGGGFNHDKRSHHFLGG